MDEPIVVNGRIILAEDHKRVREAWNAYHAKVGGDKNALSVKAFLFELNRLGALEFMLD